MNHLIFVIGVSFGFFIGYKFPGESTMFFDWVKYIVVKLYNKIKTKFDK